MKKKISPLKLFLCVLPLCFLLGVSVLLYLAFDNDPRALPSVLIDQPVPAFELENLAGDKVLTTDSFAGEPWVLNVWASWCAECQKEVQELAKIKQLSNIPLVGLDYKDETDIANRWLAQFGNPYDEIIQDKEGFWGIDLGVYGVPETFIIDKEGSIRYKLIGIVTDEIIEKEMMPIIKQLTAE